MEKYRRRESLKDLAHELNLLFPHGYDGISNMDQGRRLRDEKIKDLRKTNGTLQEGYERILKDLKHARGRRYILREYYKKVNKILQDTRAISREELKEFLAGAENYNADLGNKRYTILIAGETSAGKSSLINLLLNDHVLPTAMTQNTHTICEISYGVRKEAVIHFSKSSKPARILHENKFAKIKEYIEKPVQDEDSCKRIEIKIPNLLLKGGVVIVDSPGIGDTEQVNKIALEYLPQACTFIYVINSSNAGGLQEDRLLRILREWIKLYKGEKPCGITAESALFVCNKWDEVEKQGSQKEDLKRHIADKLREKIPDLDEKTQVIKLSALTAAELQGRFEVMSDDLTSLINGLQRLLPLCIQRKSEHLYRQLKHKHIVAFYGVAIEVKDHKLLFLLLVFDLCTGSLKNHIFKNDDRIPWKTPNAAVDTVQWTKQILDAIEFIHSHNIVHRDLKLDNILMSRHDHIKVADLGLAKLQGRILGTVCGTPLYMAPEVHDGKPYCTKADMYSFGLIMWEMWFGKTVFSELRCERGELLRRIKEENYRPQTPRSDGRFAPNLPPAQWTEVMTSCWQTESSLRKSAAESKDFVKEIKHSLAGI